MMLCTVISNLATWLVWFKIQRSEETKGENAKRGKEISRFSQGQLLR